ncbi:hypothetical protein [Streptosporangium sp. CA-115845]|uniref:hypothetical protein n=1 Tax=Streptosporangium sp. CA-115845 TaxID=3240071 RepID=UPI003D8B62CF
MSEAHHPREDIVSLAARVDDPAAEVTALTRSAERLRDDVETLGAALRNGDEALERRITGLKAFLRLVRADAHGQA